MEDIETRPSPDINPSKVTSVVGAPLQKPVCMAFTFENLDVYKRAFASQRISKFLFPNIAHRLIADLRDPLSRATLSIPLNIAEGNGRWHQADKRQFFWIARGSVFECVPLLEILKNKTCISTAEYSSYRSDLEALGKMLTKLVQAHDA